MKEYKVITATDEQYIIKVTDHTIKDLIEKGIIVDYVEVK